MRIFEHRIFSKSFGGKIRHNWTDVTYRTKKKRRMRIISTRIFLSFLAGKIEIFEQPLIQVLFSSDKKLFLKKSN